MRHLTNGELNLAAGGNLLVGRAPDLRILAHAESWRPVAAPSAFTWAAPDLGQLAAPVYYPRPLVW